MLKGPPLKHNKDFESNADIIVHWNADPDVVMQAVHEELRKHGLKVVTHETTDCSYAYSIRKISR